MSFGGLSGPKLITAISAIAASSTGPMPKNTVAAPRRRTRNRGTCRKKTPPRYMQEGNTITVYAERQCYRTQKQFLFTLRSRLFVHLAASHAISRVQPPARRPRPHRKICSSSSFTRTPARDAEQCSRLLDPGRRRRQRARLGKVSVDQGVATPIATGALEALFGRITTKDSGAEAAAAVDGLGAWPVTSQALLAEVVLGDVGKALDGPVGQPPALVHSSVVGRRPQAVTKAGVIIRNPGSLNRSTTGPSCSSRKRPFAIIASPM